MTDNEFDEVSQFYLSKRDGDKNIFDIWEAGKPCGDSLTPSTYNLEYRQWMVNKISNLLKNNPQNQILSIGCGNAFIEHELAKKNYSIFAIDILEYAVDLARKKGITAVSANVKEWEPDNKEYDLIYCDGIMGHLYNHSDGLRKIITRLKTWLKSKDAILFISNDESTNQELVQTHPSVKGFHWFSDEFLRSELTSVGFSKIDIDHFIYDRPLSGKRKRIIASAVT